MQQERRKQVFTSPSFDNRVFRKGTIKGYSQKQRKDLDTSDPMQAAQAMRNMGMKMGEDGSLMPTQNWGGLMGKASQQLNALSRGAQAGEGSGLGGPAGTMYDRAPGFYNRAPSGLARGDYGTGAEGFGQMLAQTREQRVAQSQQDGTFGTIRDKYNLDNADKGMQMNKFGNIVKKVSTPKEAGKRPLDKALIEKRGFGSPVGQDAPMGSRTADMGDQMGRRSGVEESVMGQREVVTPARTGASAPQMSPSQMMNRAALEEAVTAKKLLGQVAGGPTVSEQGGVKSVTGKYGSGFATETKGPREEGKIGGRPFSEVMQGLANKPGIAREGDKFQPQNWSESLKKAKKK